MFDNAEMNSTAEEEDFAHHLATAIEGVFSIPSFIVYLLVIFVILTNRQEFGGIPYYTLLLSLAISDCILLIEIILYNIPATLMGRDLFGRSFERIVSVFRARVN